MVGVKRGGVANYPGNYADYVYRLENQLRHELELGNGAEIAPTKPGAPSEAPSDYHLRKQRKSAKRKLAGQIRRCEEQQAAYRQEKESLEAELAADPARWSRELTDRCAALAALIQEEERRWLQLTEELERLPR